LMTKTPHILPSYLLAIANIASLCGGVLEASRTISPLPSNVDSNLMAVIPVGMSPL